MKRPDSATGNSAEPFVERANDFLARVESRNQRRKSPWNLMLIPLALVGWLATWFFLFRAVWLFHVWLYPDHLLRNFWGRGISFTGFIPSFLMLFGLAPAALCLGIVFANCVAWVMPPARHAFEREAAGFPEDSFVGANVGLLRAAKWVLPLGLLVSLLGASLLRSLR
jgi:hypothetical protein